MAAFVGRTLTIDAHAVYMCIATHLAIMRCVSGTPGRRSGSVYMRVYFPETGISVVYMIGTGSRFRSSPADIDRL